MSWRRTLGAVVVTGIASVVLLVGGAGSASAAPAPALLSSPAPALLSSPAPALLSSPAPALPLISDCKEAPTPEVPGRGVVGFFSSAPKDLPPVADPFVANSTTTVYEQYGYAGLRWNTYDLGCGPDVVRAPDATFGTSIGNWLLTVPKAMVAATGAIVSAAFAPDFLGVFDPLVSTVVDVLRRTVFEQWVPLVLAAAGLLFIWRARQASFASTTAAIGWALLVMVIATMIFKWPLLAGQAADTTVTTTLGAVAGGLNEKEPGQVSNPGAEAVAGMQNALLYQAWLGGTFGDANSEVAKKYGPAIFDAQALTWREAATLRDDPGAGKRIIEAKQEKFTQTAAKIADEDPDAYDYLTGRRSDTRVGYALLSGVAALCTVPFLLVSGLLVLGALIIVRFGVMLFPAFATLGMFPTMRSLVTGIGNTLAAAVINAIIFGIGAAITVRAVGVLLAPGSGLAGWLQIVLVLLLTISMWAALRPFRRLTDMVPGDRNHFAGAAGGITSTGRNAGRLGARVLGTAVGSYLGNRAASRDDDARPELIEAPQRVEGDTTYTGPPVVVAADAPAPAPAPGPASLGRVPVHLTTAGGVTVVQSAGSSSVATGVVSGAAAGSAARVTVVRGEMGPQSGAASAGASGNRMETVGVPGGGSWFAGERTEDVDAEELADIWTPGAIPFDDDDVPARSGSKGGAGRAELPELGAGRGR